MTGSWSVLFLLVYTIVGFNILRRFYRFSDSFRSAHQILVLMRESMYLAMIHTCKLVVTQQYSL